jgi:uncharacterized protein (TIGR02996 family)
MEVLAMKRFDSTGFRRPSLALLLAVVLSHAPVETLAQATPDRCGPLSIAGQFGPYDYRKHKDKVATVEPYHFTPQVEALIKSINGKLGGDIAYTLQRIPNHHRALASLIRLGERERRDKPDGEDWSVECRLERAMRFAPDDLVARLLYADFLRRQKRQAEAERQLERVSAQPDLSPFLLASIGIMYLDLDKVPKAVEFAELACQQGLSASPLYQQLVGRGAFPKDRECKAKD